MVHSDKHTVEVFKWEATDSEFVSYKSFQVNGEVQGITTGDFDYDGKLDIIVTATDNSGTYLEVFTYTDSEFKSEGAKVAIPDGAQPAVFDVSKSSK